MIPVAYEVTHRTEYRYSSTVSASFGEIIMLPRDLPGQACLRSQLTIDPQPHDLRERLDFFGNRTTSFAVLAPHTRLCVSAVSLVQVSGRLVAGIGAVPWEKVRDGIRTDPGDEALDARQFVLDSPLVRISDDLAAYATPSFPAGRPLLAAAVDLASRIHRDFTYDPGATHVTTTIEEVLESRTGVCQDFAHLATGCLRSLGLAARYVSGYLETEPPPGRERLAGADASHAWVSVFMSGAWVGVDPTNDQLVDDRYITTAWGRDYADVAPLKGVIFTQAEDHDLHVTVDVLPVDPPD